MKNLLFILLLGVCACAPKPSVYTTNHDWSEPADPATHDARLWEGVQGAGASFGSIDVRYVRSEPFGGELLREHSLVGWKGEKVSAQLVVWTSAEIPDLRCEVGRFEGEQGAKLGDIGRARFVNYVLSDWFIPERPCGAREPDALFRVVSDLLDEAPTSRVPAHTTRAVWITVDIPRDVAAGKYTSTVTLKGSGLSEMFTLGLEVVDRTLPPPSEWDYHLDLWQHPAAVARIEGVELWSDEHFEKMKPLMKMLADAGQKVITATLNKDPWNNQTYDPYADMIVWTRHADGRWEYDFSVFDRWVGFMMERGVARMINCYSMLPWNNMLHYVDATTGLTVDVKADPGTPEFGMMWEPFLPAFVSHLRERGWLELTNIAMDERSTETMEETVSLLARVAPELGIALADNQGIFRKYPYIRDMSASIFHPIAHADILARRAQGLVTTYYVCCSSDFPNTYTFSDPAEAVYLAWHAAAHDYDGFLRWAYNSWTEDPIRDSRFRTWSAGDTYIVYPEGRSSIRFERLIEGVQDFEKMRLLRAESGGASLWLDPLMEQFKSYNRDWDWNAALNAAKRKLK